MSFAPNENEIIEFSIDAYAKYVSSHSHEIVDLDSFIGGYFDGFLKATNIAKGLILSANANAVLETIMKDKQ